MTTTVSPSKGLQNASSPAGPQATPVQASAAATPGCQQRRAGALPEALVKGAATQATLGLVPTVHTTSVPDGAEALTTRDIHRLVPKVVETDATKERLPKLIPLTRAQLDAELPYLCSEEARPYVTFARLDGRDHLLITGRTNEVAAAIPLADRPRAPSRNSPVARIAAIANSAPASQPLKGLRVAIDPGHFSGNEDMREGKYVTRTPVPPGGETVPENGVTEGELNVISARNLARRLESLGAEVVITRQGSVARTRSRADVNAMLDADPELAKKAGNRAVFLTSLDLERRAERMAEIKPDLLITMHFDAEVNNVTEKARREVKIYVPGCFSVDSLVGKLGRSRFAQQCASTSWHASVDLATTLVQSICKATGSKPQLPSEHGAVDPKVLRPVGDDTGVFARSLRLPHAVPGEPLSVYLEGAHYNHPDIFPEMFKERGSKFGVPGGFLDRYAGSIADGLVAFVRSRRS